MNHRVVYLADHPTYVEEVARLKYAQWRHTSPDRPYRVWVAEIEDSARKGGLPTTLVALGDTELLGFVTLVALKEKAGIENGLWLITLYVKALYRGAGLGLSLIERCTAEARNLGYPALHLWTESPRLTAYYARNGWRRIGRDDDSRDDIMVYELGTRLNGDPLPWLLENDPANPGVRFFALRELLGRSEDDPEVCQARANVMTLGPVPVILDAQYPAGYWIKPGGGYSPSYRATVWQVIFLAELGADPGDERVRRGCEYLLGHSIAANGGFSMSHRPVSSSVVHCLNGGLLYALLRLGYAHDPRVQAALDWQVRAIIGEGAVRYFRSGTAGPGFACAYNLGQPCAWGATKGMKALSAVPPEQRTAEVQRAIEAGAEFLLSRDLAAADYPFTERVNATWFKFGFPLSYRTDVLETAAALADLGYADDRRLINARQFILRKQDSQGRWNMEKTHNGKMWANVEEQGKPSKWVTFRALRVLGMEVRK